MKSFVLLGVAVIMAVGAVGCDDQATSDVLSFVTGTLPAANGLQNGDALMEQIQQRSQLCDGSCQDCPNPNAGTQYRWGWDNATGNGDQDRLRDGSCQN